MREVRIRDWSCDSRNMVIVQYLKKTLKTNGDRKLKNKLPEIKNEIVIRDDFPNKQCLSASVATQRALDWFVNEASKFENKSCLFSILQEKIKDKQLPNEINVVISSCYDVQEVKAYLETPVFK
jgi:hypothetical protein